MNLKIEFGFGIGERADGTPIRLTERNAALDKISLEAAEQFGGYTLVHTSGGWVDGNGRLVREEGRTLVCYQHVQDQTINRAYNADRALLQEKIDRMFLTIKTELNQTAICIAVTVLESFYIREE